MFIYKLLNLDRRKEARGHDGARHIMLAGGLEREAAVNANLSAHPYYGTGYRLEIYGPEGTLALIVGGDVAEEVNTFVDLVLPETRYFRI